MRRLPPPQSSPLFHFNLHQPKTKPPTPTPTPLSTTINQVAPTPAQAQRNTPLPASVLPAFFPRTALRNKGRLTPGLGGSHPGASKLTTTKHRRHDFARASATQTSHTLTSVNQHPTPLPASVTLVLLPQAALLLSATTPKQSHPHKHTFHQQHFHQQHSHQPQPCSQRSATATSSTT